MELNRERNSWGDRERKREKRAVERTEKKAGEK